MSNAYNEQPFPVGSTVFALWAYDGYYYPGTISALGQFNLALIHYFDGQVAWVEMKDLIDFGYAVTRRDKSATDISFTTSLIRKNRIGREGSVSHYATLYYVLTKT